MKKLLSLILAVVFLSMPLVTFASETDDKAEIFLSIYDDTKDKYIVSNIKLYVDSSVSVTDTLKALQEQELIENYSESSGKPFAISLKNSTLTNTGDSQIYAKKNGLLLKDDQYLLKVENGDIIEWIYGIPDKSFSKDEQTQNVLSTELSIFTDEYKESLEQGCDYLVLSDKKDEFYYIALSCANKMPDSKKISYLLSEIRKEEAYTNPSDLSKDIMALTSCGYDAQSFVNELASFEDIGKIGTFGYINTLYAYDCNSYVLNEDEAVNTRERMIENILSLQRESGGFSYTKKASDDVDTTAMVITALSPYIEDERVKNAIDLAVKFLISAQTDDGGFLSLETENSESLSQVIIALSSIGIPFDDARFSKNGMSLVDKLLEYQNTDGGFSHILNAESNIMATQQAVIALSAANNMKNPYNKTQKLIEIPKTSTNDLSVSTKMILLVAALGIIVIIVFTVFVILKKKPSNKLKQKD